MTLAQLLSRRVILITGKGGVGKSAVSASLGLLGARAGKKTLLVELGGQSVMSTYLGGDRSHYTPTRRGNSLHTITLTPPECMEEYLTRELHSHRLYKMVFQNEYVAPFVQAVPALEDLVYIGKIMDLERARQNNGQPEWDLIVVDGPPTGQGLNLLRVPQAIMDMTRMGPMYKNTRIIHELITDPARTAVCLVTLAEEMPVNETVEMYRVLKGEIGVPFGPVFVNEVRRRYFEGEEIDALETLTHSFAESGQGPVDFREKLGALLDATRAIHRRMELEQHQISRLKEHIHLPVVELPRLLTRLLGPEVLGHLANRLEAGLEHL